MDIAETLNPQQLQAVQAGAGPVLVLAGPGSGKTRVLTHRAAYLIDQLNVKPFHLIAVTFTNKAADEMGERIGRLLGRQTLGVTLGTFHAICARILRSEADHLPVNANYVIFDADDQIRVVKQVLQDLNVDEKRYRPHSVHNAISSAKNELYLPEDFPVETYRDEVISRVYQEYQKILLASNAMDFDDLLLWMAVLLSDKKRIREKYARRFQHILVDEFQDTNIAQYTLLRQLASVHRNLFVVGDSDQSIYRWRGADYRNVKRFEEDFPEAEIILLEQNYRSTQNILETAMAVIGRNTQRTPKKLFTERGEGGKIVIEEFFDEREQAQFVVDTIRRQTARKQAAPADFAVMYRTNAQSRILEEAFLSANIPYRLVGAQRFYGRREIKDIIAYLRVIVNPDDLFSLRRIISTPPRGIGTKTFASLLTRAQQRGISPGWLLLELGEPESPERDHFSTREESVLTAFGRHLKSWREDYPQLPPVEIVDRVLTDIGYESYLVDGSEDGDERWENVVELRRLASEYQVTGLLPFLEDVALVSDQDTLEGGQHVPTLLTLHAAKGLEFPQVFIVGINDGLLPHQRSFDDPEAMEEERRLFYVGITRAEDRLYLLHALNRYTYGYMEPMEPSRYYRDIPVDVRAQEGENIQIRSAGSSDQRLHQWQDLESREQAAPKQEREYKPGTRVNHPTWGEGLVINSKLQDDDEVVDIFFEGEGKKKVLASLADLEVLD